MEKVILYYKFVPIDNPELVRLWQKSLCEKLNLRGRIIISVHGLNGTLGGRIDDLKTYVKETTAYPALKGLDVKWSHGSRDDFPKLSIKVREEVVTFGAKEELKIDEHGVVGGGQHISPEAVHKLAKQYGKDLVFFDGRSRYEAAIGRFKNAVVPDIRTAKDFIKEIEKPKYNKLKDKPVVTYCTGGIRCEVLSLLMKNRGFKQVYQLDGGIVKYGEKYGDKGLWEGALYVFDKRMTQKFSEEAKDIANCIHCGQKTSHYKNCANLTCNALIISCEACKQKTTCSPKCERVLKSQTAIRA